MSDKTKRVHLAPTRASTASEHANATGKEPPVVVAVTLDNLEEGDPQVDQSENVGGPVEVDEELSVDDDTLPLPEDDDDDDEDLSLLEGTAPVAKSKTTEVDEDDEDEEGYLEIFREECLQCKSLVPFAKKKFKECHFSKGNKHCPAAKTSVVIRVPIEDIVPRYLSAEKSNDFKRLARFNMKLSEKPEYFQHRVAQAIAEARKK